MSRLPGILSIVAVVVLAMAFAAANAGNRVTLELGLITLYRAPVTLVAFSGLLVGMVVMFGLYMGLSAAFEGLEPALLFRFIRYGLVGLWGGLGAPWAFTKLRLAGTRAAVEPATS